MKNDQGYLALSACNCIILLVFVVCVDERQYPLELFLCPCRWDGMNRASSVGCRVEGADPIQLGGNGSKRM